MAFDSFNDPHLMADFPQGPGVFTPFTINGQTPQAQDFNGYVAENFIPQAPAIGPALPQIEYSNLAAPANNDHFGGIANALPIGSIYG